MYWIGLFLGALVVTFLITRLFLWISRNWGGEPMRIVYVHAASLLLIFVVAGFGMADGGPFRTGAFLYYLFPQGLWLAFDLFRWQKAQAPAN